MFNNKTGVSLRTLYLLIFLSITALFCIGAAENEIEGYPHLKQMQLGFTGAWLPNYDPAFLPEGDFADIQNMRYCDSGIKGVSGYSDINSSALSTYLKVRNGFHFYKDQPVESHILVSAYNSGETASRVMQNTTVVPNAGDFSATVVHTDAAGADIGRFAAAPLGTMTYCNGKESLIWGGDESVVGGFVNYDPNYVFSYDYSEAINDPVNATDNNAVLHGASGGIDNDVMLLLILDNNVTDTSPVTPHTVTNNNVTFDAATKVFGTHSAVFNGTTAYLTVPDNADFDFSTGVFTIDTRCRIDTLPNNDILYYQKTDIEAIGFTLGALEPVAGDTITGKVTGKTAIVDSVVVTGGTWAGGNAAGTIYVHTVSGVFNAEIVTVGGVDSLALDADFADHGDNYMQAVITPTGEVQILVYECYGAGASVVDIRTPAATIAVNTWYHVEIVEDGSIWYIFVDGVLKVSLSGETDRAKNYISTVQIGYNNTVYYDGFIDEYRISDVARHTTNFEIPTQAYSSSTALTYFYIGTTRANQGFKPYIDTVNTLPSTMQVYYWTGGVWLPVSGLVDGTSASGISLAQPGSVSYTSTVGYAKTRYLNGRVLYWYKVFVSAVSANTDIYYATANAPIQAIKDLWSGDYSGIASFRKWDAVTYTDYTIEVADPDSLSVAVLDSLATTHYVYVGFTEPQQALDVYLVAGKENSNNCLMTLAYFNGTSWAAITKDDGTLSGATSFGKSGVVSWTGIAHESEFPASLAGEGPFYYYQIAFSATLDAEVEINYIAGIPASKSILAYQFPIYYQNRTLLCNREGKPSEILIGAQDSPDVFSGNDSKTITLGSDALTAGAGIFNRFGSSIYNFAIFTQLTKTWLMDGYSVSGDGQFRTYQVSSTIGCPAPLTMTVCEIPYEIAQDALRHIVLWLSYDGPVGFDAGVVKPIAGIEPYFNPNDSRCINYTCVDSSKAFFDPLNKEWNLLIPSGSSATTNNVWLIYDILRKKWFKKSPAAYPQSGWIVQDTKGTQYPYLGFDDGFVRRDENGNTFDGTPITQYVVTGDIVPEKSIWGVCQIDFLKLVCKAKNTGTATTISAWHRSNATDTWAALAGVPMFSTGNRLVQHTQRLNKRGIDHQFKFQAVTSDIADGFEPLAMGLMYHTVATDTVAD